jgi:lipopolysaccharide export system permease protein
VERRDDKSEEVITSESGRLAPAADGTRLLLSLSNGLIASSAPSGRVRTVRFREASLNEDFTAVPPPYRERGNSVRELTLPELRSAASDSETVNATQRAGEFHGRVARTFLPLLLPLLALPLGMAAKRGRRAPGTVFAALALLALNQALQFGESLGETGRAPAWLAVWLPWVVFAVLGLWLFRSSLQWPGDNPVMRAVSAIEGAFEGMQRKKKAPAK